jgi:methionyl-tRNA synthetase
MGHQVKDCPKCGSWVMEGCSCDNCGDSSGVTEPTKDQKRWSLLREIETTKYWVKHHKKEVKKYKKELETLESQL